jgi:hypothetical protein
MDMTVIDTVRADTLQIGDVVEDSYGALSEIINIEDTVSYVLVYTETDDEVGFSADDMVNIYGYMNSED